MHLTVFEQSEIFRCAFLFGLFLGVWYDFFRLLRAIGFNSRAEVFFQDIIFMLGLSIMCALFAQTTVHGHFRMFVMAAHLLGILAYRFSVGMLTSGLFWVIGVVLRWISSSANAVFNMLSKSILRMSAYLSRIFCRIHLTKPQTEDN